MFKKISVGLAALAAFTFRSVPTLHPSLAVKVGRD